MTILWISIAALVLLTSLTGTIMVIIWYAIGLTFERIGFANIVYELLKMVELFFLLPIAFIALKLNAYRVGRGYLFSPTPLIVNICKGFVLIWAAGAVNMLIYIILELSWVKYQYREAFRCPSRVQAMFDDLKATLHLESSPLRLVQCYRAKTPFTMGVLQPKIVLPVENYTEKELRVILLHEMTHYKQKDIVLKLFSHIVIMFHFFNPFAWILFSKIQKWSEFVCDSRASVYVGGIREYFDVILNISMDSPLKSGLISHLAKNQHELRERALKLRRINKMKKRSKMSMILVLCTAFMLSSTSVYAATVECADAYISMERVTAIEASQALSVTVDSDVTVEYGDTPDVVCVEGELQQTSGRSSNAFEWDLQAGYRYYFPYITCEADSVLCVSAVVDPDDVVIRVGIEDSMGYRFYVEGADVLYKTFEISSAGRYRVYLQNNTDTDVTVAGSYITR